VCCCLLMACLWVALPSQAMMPALLIDKDLEQTSVQVRSMEDGWLSVFNDRRELVQVRSDEYVALEPNFPYRLLTDQPASIEWEESVSHCLILADGQMVYGRWLGGDGNDGQTILFRHRYGQVWAIALEDIRSLLPYDQSMEMGMAGGDDVVLLANGDRLTGFVEAIGALSSEQSELAVWWTGPDSQEPTPLSMEAVSGVVLANPERDQPEGAHLIVLDSGEKLFAHDLVMDGQDLTGTLTLCQFEDPPVLTLPLVIVERIEFTGHGHRLASLWDMEWKVVSGGSFFGIPALPRMDHQLMRLHAPLMLSVVLPSEAAQMKVSFALDLPLDLDPSSEALAHVRVGVAVGEDVESARQAIVSWGTLDQRDQVVSFNLPIERSEDAPTDLRVAVIVLEEADNGPVLDRVKVIEATVLLKP